MGWSEFGVFAAGLRRDHHVVAAAVLFPWRNRQVEGQLHRVRLLKRAMYGRADFAFSSSASSAQPEADQDRRVRQTYESPRATQNQNHESIDGV